MQEAFSVDSFCQAFDVERSFAYSEMRAGRLEFRKAGRRTLIRKADAEAWLDSLPKGNLETKAGE